MFKDMRVEEYIPEYNYIQEFIHGRTQAESSPGFPILKRVPGDK